MIQAQREFIADASHELRTPLTSILANLELLQEELAEAERARRAGRDRRLGAALLAADAPAGRRPAAAGPRRRRAHRRPARDATSPRSPRRRWPRCARSPASTSSSSHAATSVVGRRQPRRAPPARGQPARQRRPPHARRARRSRSASSGATGTPCSRSPTTGPGIPRPTREQIFSRFARARRARRPRSPDSGTGLGLAIVEAVAAARTAATVEVGDRPRAALASRSRCRVARHARSRRRRLGARLEPRHRLLGSGRDTTPAGGPPSATAGELAAKSQAAGPAGIPPPLDSGGPLFGRAVARSRAEQLGELLPSSCAARPSRPRSRRSGCLGRVGRTGRVRSASIERRCAACSKLGALRQHDVRGEQRAVHDRCRRRSRHPRAPARSSSSALRPDLADAMDLAAAFDRLGVESGRCRLSARRRQIPGGRSSRRRTRWRPIPSRMASTRSSKPTVSI